ncbi:hypothetical protein EXW61_02880 [Bacillus mycoides]|nr:hypothetical protein E1A90_25690 [Bacillus mycoides]QWG82478.1 hypothetical protein EXW61_02880 [Bacillus mycoides]
MVLQKSHVRYLALRLTVKRFPEAMLYQVQLLPSQLLVSRPYIETHS